ncbi:MAG: hypothetical protein RLZZ414_351 [Bacteroidota bacterium]|jgi:hypothetical protein
MKINNYTMYYYSLINAVQRTKKFPDLKVGK